MRLAIVRMVGLMSLNNPRFPRKSLKRLEEQGEHNAHYQKLSRCLTFVQAASRAVACPQSRVVSRAVACPKACFQARHARRLWQEGGGSLAKSGTGLRRPGGSLSVSGSTRSLQLAFPYAIWYSTTYVPYREGQRTMEGRPHESRQQHRATRGGGD